MKYINDYIAESLLSDDEELDKRNFMTEHPKTLRQLKKIVKQSIEELGNNCDLNFIDVSSIKNMDDLFFESEFNGDISQWDVSNVVYMNDMFARSKFNGDISKWKLKKAKYLCEMFCSSEFNGDISKWDVSSVIDMRGMFRASKFNGDISKWKISNKCDTSDMYNNCEIPERNTPKGTYHQIKNLSSYIKEAQSEMPNEISDFIKNNCSSHTVRYNYDKVDSNEIDKLYQYISGLDTNNDTDKAVLKFVEFLYQGNLEQLHNIAINKDGSKTGKSLSKALEDCNDSSCKFNNKTELGRLVLYISIYYFNQLNPTDELNSDTTQSLYDIYKCFTEYAKYFNS